VAIATSGRAETGHGQRQGRPEQHDRGRRFRQPDDALKHSEMIASLSTADGRRS
jgi:hypothetical protein